MALVMPGPLCLTGSGPDSTPVSFHHLDFLNHSLLRTSKEVKV